MNKHRPFSECTNESGFEAKVDDGACGSLCFSSQGKYHFTHGRYLMELAKV